MTSAQDVDSESLASLISSVTDDNVLPLDLILSVAKKNNYTDASPTASTQPIKLSPRYDYNYDDFTNFYRFFEKALLASKGEILECIAQADNLTLRQRAFLLAALYLRQQARPASGGLFYEGKLGSYFLKDATLDELTPNEAQLIGEFVTKCEINDEELFPKELTLHTPNEWEESFRKNAKRLQSVLVVDPILPKADAPYWQKFYNEASLEDIYFVLMFETDVTTQRLLTSASAKEKAKLYKPLSADEVVVTQEEAQIQDDEAQLSDKERYFETRMARAFLLTQPIIQGFRHIDKAEPQLKTVHTLHDMTTVLPIIPTVTE
ncbi:MAG: hypothetical protein Q4G03_08775 [Planctomycetia bacterium]|nr:hypothetical protein [Planctomycetia bacterium]